VRHPDRHGRNHFHVLNRELQRAGSPAGPSGVSAARGTVGVSARVLLFLTVSCSVGASHSLRRRSDTYRYRRRGQNPHTKGDPRRPQCAAGTALTRVDVRSVGTSPRWSRDIFAPDAARATSTPRDPLASFAAAVIRRRRSRSRRRQSLALTLVSASRHAAEPILYCQWALGLSGSRRTRTCVLMVASRAGPHHTRIHASRWPSSPPLYRGFRGLPRGAPLIPRRRTSSPPCPTSHPAPRIRRQRKMYTGIPLAVPVCDVSFRADRRQHIAHRRDFNGVEIPQHVFEVCGRLRHAGTKYSLCCEQRIVPLRPGESQLSRNTRTFCANTELRRRKKDRGPEGLLR